MTRNSLYIVRHGQSENNVLKVDSTKLENKDQFGLTSEGRRGTQRQAAKIRGFDLIVTSPFRRAKETARIFAQTSHCEVIENELLKEQCQGDLELVSYEVTDAFFDAHGKDESVPFPNGESLLDVKNRARQFLDELEQQYTKQKILLVTHGHVVGFLREHLDPNFDRKQAIEDYNDADSRRVFEIGRPESQRKSGD